ncbi:MULTISPECIES: methyl-accepting chemotaxis protein [unclassified Bosea (in: a-proteobacteria)]|uniref:methyl-accepting chemotaxis protein n=1 Tax=unclassified Bosea (in: a-proteobacteria) TaxID=2653178 RepID=UPI000954CFE2|nr:MULTISPECIES: methyl-accepting chemotaxis protein [unclassified Bosea (in: a-proteobacteria)]TAJ33856.1 MAG: hypothetical protein EPO59_03765 [Bosea sp. (in: a-proteobacteria)]SIR53679.1 methyl-accepting chemotaxis sensory transducer with Pas/Pac sensor [Bosea sp. TND4EK4]
MPLLVHLLSSLSFVLLAALTLTAMLHRLESSRFLRAATIGLVFLAAGLCGMANPWVLDSGLIVDSRTTTAILSAALGGPLSMALTAVPLAIYRYQLGGSSQWLGIAGIAGSGLAGCLVYLRARRQGRHVSSQDTVWLALASAGMLLLPLLVMADHAPPWQNLTRALPIALGINVLGTVLGGLIVFHDMERRENAYRLDALIARAPGMLYQRTKAPDGTIRYKFASYCLDALLGLSRADVERDPEVWRSRMLPEDRRRVEEEYLEHGATKGQWRYEARFVAMDESIVWLRMDIAIRRLADGTELWDAVLLDVTDERTLADRKQELEGERRSALSELASDLERSVGAALGEVAGSVRSMRSAATEMTGSADNTIGRADAVTSQAKAVSDRVGSVAHAAEEIEISIRELTRQITHADQTARDAARYVRGTRRDIAALGEAADKVSAVLGFIEDIATRTNLLALNATIEAARAGAAGRGFAVVAAEVKSLAEQTQQATRDIAETLEGIHSAAGKTAEAIARIEETMTTIEGTSGAIAGLADHQAGIVSGIASDAQLVAGGTSAVSASIATVGKEARVTGAAAARVATAAAKVDEQTAALDRYVAEFVQGVRRRL